MRLVHWNKSERVDFYRNSSVIKYSCDSQLYFVQIRYKFSYGFEQSFSVQFKNIVILWKVFFYLWYEAQYPLAFTVTDQWQSPKFKVTKYKIQTNVIWLQ